jgi:hypothetical protein
MRGLVMREGMRAGIKAGMRAEPTESGEAEKEAGAEKKAGRARRKGAWELAVPASQPSRFGSA